MMFRRPGKGRYNKNRRREKRFGGFWFVQKEKRMKMKKLLLGALAALGIFGAYRLHAQNINPTSPETNGIIASIDREAGSFQIEVNGNEGLQMIFFTRSQTEFLWLANGEGGSNKAAFSDLKPGMSVKVVYTTNNDMTESVAEQVIIEQIK